MRIPFRLVDVFTDRPLVGNQLCVVPEGSGLEEDVMQAVAREIGFSETTFVTEARDGRYSMRIFTPAEELPFAGHPSLGTAFVLVSEGRVATPAVQSVPAGEFPIEVDVAAGSARMRQGAPQLGPEADRSGVAAAVGLHPADLHPELPPQTVSTGLGHLLVPVHRDMSVASARPNEWLLEAIMRDVEASGVYVFHASGGRARARLFFRAVGLREDAATGSAAGPLGAYLAEHEALDSRRLTVTQGVEMGRPSTLLVDVEGGPGAWTVFVAGGVVKVGEGWFDLP